MLKQTEIAKRWGYSRNTISKFVKRGMPLTSFKAAEKWRAANPPTKAQNSGGMSKAMREKVEKANNVVEKARTAIAIKPPKKTGDSMLDSLNSMIFAGEMAYAAYIKAFRENSITQGARLSEHIRAVTARLATEKAYREEMERRKTLVNQSEILQICRAGVNAVINRLRRFPKEVGPQCNPQNPHQAQEVLEKAINNVLKIGAKAVHDLRTTES